MKKIGFIFPGQGSQYIGMGKDIYEAFNEAKEVFDRASDALHLNIKNICFYGPKEKLGLTTYTQPAILTNSFALYSCIKKIIPSFLAGHSLGEFTTLVVGGALSFENAVALVHDRGRFMQEAMPEDKGAMAAIIGLENPKVEEICTEASKTAPVWPANYNCPGQVVISGYREGVSLSMEMAKQGGAKMTILLSVSIPSHCPLMDKAAQRLAERFNQIEIMDLNTPMVSNYSATILHDSRAIKTNLIHQLTSPVRWEDSIRLMIKEGIEIFIEIGPAKVLTKLLKKINKEIKGINVFDVASIKGLERVIK